MAKAVKRWKDCEMRIVRRIGGRVAAISALALCSTVVSYAADTTFVKLGDKITIEYPIENIPPTDGPAEGVKISARVEPAEFASAVTIDEAGATLGPLDIGSQQTQTFVVKCTVGLNAPEGPFKIVLHADMITVGATPDITDPSQDVEVGFALAKGLTDFTLQLFLLHVSLESE
jgi:hypothetical protein